MSARAGRVTHLRVLVRAVGRYVRTRWIWKRSDRRRWPETTRGCPRGMSPNFGRFATAVMFLETTIISVAITVMFLGTTLMFLASAVMCQATALVLGQDSAIVLHFPCKAQGLRRNVRTKKCRFRRS